MNVRDLFLRIRALVLRHGAMRSPQRHDEPD
jgi:hypothetical protein